LFFGYFANKSYLPYFAKLVINQLLFIMSTKKKENSQETTNVVERAIRDVAGFEVLYHSFRRNLSIEGKSKGTLAGYGRHLAGIALHFGRTPLELDTEEVLDYLYALQQRSQTSSQTCFKHTVFGLRFLLKSEGLPYTHLQLPAIQHDKKLPVVLSKEEVWRLLRSPKLLKHRILLGVLYGCGLRCFEVCNLRLRDLDFDRKLLHVVQGKGKKDRYLPLSQYLIRGLQAYIASDNPQDWLFNGQPVAHSTGASHTRYSERGLQCAVKQAAKQAGIRKDVHVHTLRHTFATHLLEDGLNIVTVKEMMGHSRIQTTMGYLHVARSNPHCAFSPLDTLFLQCAPKQK
jgi:site-specific recombinase XerD